MRFTGALLPLEEKNRSSLNTLIVSIKGKKWIFSIAKVEKLTGGSFDGWRLLRDIFPPEVRFLGPEELLSLLQEPEIMGKLLTLEGHLYIGSRMFFVRIVEEAAKNLSGQGLKGFSKLSMAVSLSKSYLTYSKVQNIFEIGS